MEIRLITSAISIAVGSLFLVSCAPENAPDGPSITPDPEPVSYCAQQPSKPDPQVHPQVGPDGICRAPKGGDVITVALMIAPTPTARYRITFDALWTAADFPTNFPGNAHFSRLVGTAHNQQVVFWEVDGQPASVGIESMAETGSNSALSNEVMAAQNNGYSQGFLEGSGIGSGDGDTSLEFDISIDYPLVSFVSMVAPSPDWFVGISGFPLLDDEGYWKVHEEIPLKVYDAGTDLGLQPASPNQDNSADNLPITLLSSDRADTDFEEGIHFLTSDVIGVFIIDKVEP